MTIAEITSKPDGMDLETYAKLLNKRMRLWRKMSVICEKMRDCDYAMWALDGEKGSDRWKRWSERKEKAQKDLDAVNEEFDAINMLLKK